MIKIKSIKSTQHFWSQLLIGMIAILALPATQELNYPREIIGENYQNQRHQYQQQDLITTTFVLRQVKLQQVYLQGMIAEHVKFDQNEPHFFTFLLNYHVLIRAGPIIT